MIFVTVGTHPGSFERLIKKLDLIAPKIKEEIIIQRGFTKYVPHNCVSFDFVEDLSPYYKKARIVISHSATTVLEFILSQNKPIITVPRQKRFNEHLNDHQVEFAKFLFDRTGIKAILKIEELTPELLKKYKVVPKINKAKLIEFQSFFRDLFIKMDKNEKNC